VTRPRTDRVPVGDSSLWRREEEGRDALFTRALGHPPSVYGERVVQRAGDFWRRWDPTRSKLSAALLKGWQGPEPARGERWLYLGAASGTTASHLADLTGNRGAVFAVEKSLRPFSRLLKVAQSYPNLLPILSDARRPEEYFGDVSPVDGLYLDIPQPDQTEIALKNAELFLRDHGKLIFAVKTSSMGRAMSARQHLEVVRRALEPSVDVGAVVDLTPFHRRHYLLGGLVTRDRPEVHRRPTGGRQVAVRPPR
jgi:fibrillarin-like pre-rRNA processing protein